MRFSWGLVALVCSLIANVEAQNCKNNACLKAVTLKGSVQSRKQDCSTFLATTITPVARTVTKTKTITKTTTKHPASTKTSTQKVTVSKTSSIRATKTAKVTHTEFDDQTATLTVTTSTTTVTRAFDNDDDFDDEPSSHGKRDIIKERHDIEKRAAKTTPRYASICGSTKAYKSACLCASAKVKTKTAARPTKTRTVTKTKTVTATGKPTVVKTRVVTSKTTKSTTKTFTTLTKTTTKTTEKVTRTAATDTVKVAATQTVFPTAPELPRAGFLTAIHSQNQRLYTFFGETSVRGQYALRLVASKDGADVWRYGGPGEGLILVHSSEPRAYGLSLLIDATSSRFGPEGGNGIISFVTPWDPREQHSKRQVSSSSRTQCTITPANSLQCLWGDIGEIAEWWTCDGMLSLVRPGADPRSFCNGDAVKLKAMGWSEYDGPESALEPPVISTSSSTSAPSSEVETSVSESSEASEEPQTSTPTTNPESSESRKSSEEPQTPVHTPSTSSITRPSIPNTPINTPSIISSIASSSDAQTVIPTPSITSNTVPTIPETPVSLPGTNSTTSVNTPVHTPSTESHTPAEPQPTTPSLPRRGRIKADVYYALATEFGLYEHSAYVVTGSTGRDDGDIFEYTDNGNLKIVQSLQAPEGIYVFYDSENAMFGPQAGHGVISMISPWEVDLHSAALVELGVKCTIEENDDLTCLWGWSGQNADWWFCNGHLSLVAPGVDARSKCTGTGLSSKVDSLKWVDYNGPQEPEHPVETPIATPKETPIQTLTEPEQPTETPAEPEPSSPSLPRRGRILADSSFYGFGLNIRSYEPDAYLMAGNIYPERADILEYTGPNEPLKIIRSEHGAKGLQIFYDSNGARFGPTHGESIISTFAGWPTRPESAEADQEEYGVKCTIDKNDDLKCLWGSSGQYADWWLCYGLFSLASPGADASALCGGEDEDNKIRSVKWIDYDGPLEEEPGLPEPDETEVPIEPEETAVPEPEEPEPSLPRLGRLQADNLFYGISMNPNTYEYNAFVMGGDGAKDAGDVFEYSGQDKPLRIRRSANDVVGFNMSYDPDNARFGPTQGSGVISMFSAWGASSSHLWEKEWYRTKCSIDKQNNFQCLWGSSGQYADWWMCDGCLALARPGADAKSACDGPNLNDYKLKSLKWIEFDGSLPEIPTPKPVRRGVVEFDMYGIKQYFSTSSTGRSDDGRLALSARGRSGADGLEMTGPLEPVLIYRPGVESGGLNLFYDPKRANFGPSGGDGKMSVLSPWKMGIGHDRARELATYGIKCFIEETNNKFQCYWDTSNGVLAEWWLCDGLFVLVNPGADLRGACSRYTNVGPGTWVDIDKLADE